MNLKKRQQTRPRRNGEIQSVWGLTANHPLGYQRSRTFFRVSSKFVFHLSKTLIAHRIRGCILLVECLFEIRSVKYCQAHKSPLSLKSKLTQSKLRPAVGTASLSKQLSRRVFVYKLQSIHSKAMVDFHMCKHFGPLESTLKNDLVRF